MEFCTLMLYTLFDGVCMHGIAVGKRGVLDRRPRGGGGGGGSLYRKERWGWLLFFAYKAQGEKGKEKRVDTDVEMQFKQ